MNTTTIVISLSHFFSVYCYTTVEMALVSTSLMHDSDSIEFVVVIFYFSSQDAQANLPSRRERDVPSSHKKRIWCDEGRKRRKKEEK